MDMPPLPSNTRIHLLPAASSSALMDEYGSASTAFRDLDGCQQRDFLRCYARRSFTGRFSFHVGITNIQSRLQDH